MKPREYRKNSPPEELKPARTQQEVADLIGMSAQYVKKYEDRAMKKLREELAKHDPGRELE